MNDNKKNFINEAIKLVRLIDESKINEKSISFFLSIKGKVKFPATSFVSEKQIFWLRDIKDKQLDYCEDDDYRDDIENSY